MKKFLLMMALCLMALGAQAQSKKFCGTITFRDGHEETYTELYVPARNTDKLMVRPDGGKIKKIPSEDIQMVTVWSAKFPDMKSTIFCLQMEDNRDKFVIWGVPFMSSKWGVVFRCYDNYTINPKTGELTLLVLLDESLAKLAKPGLQTWQPLVLQRFDKEIAETVAFIRSYKKLKNKVREDVFEYMWPKNTPKQGAKVFEENEEIHQQILDGTLTAADLQYIIDQM